MLHTLFFTYPLPFVAVCGWFWTLMAHLLFYSMGFLLFYPVGPSVFIVPSGSTGCHVNGLARTNVERPNGLVPRWKCMVFWLWNMINEWLNNWLGHRRLPHKLWKSQPIPPKKAPEITGNVRVKIGTQSVQRQVMLKNPGYHGPANKGLEIGQLYCSTPSFISFLSWW